MTLQAQDNPNRILSRKEAAEIWGVSVPTLDRLHAEGKGPKRLNLSVRRVGYRIADVQEWLEKPRNFEVA